MPSFEQTLEDPQLNYERRTYLSQEAHEGKQDDVEKQLYGARDRLEQKAFDTYRSVFGQTPDKATYFDLLGNFFTDDNGITGQAYIAKLKKDADLAAKAQADADAAAAEQKKQNDQVVAEVKTYQNYAAQAAAIGGQMYAGMSPGGNQFTPGTAAAPAKKSFPLWAVGALLLGGFWLYKKGKVL